MPVLFLLILTMFLQSSSQVSNTEWQSVINHDDFTDEVSHIAALVSDETGKALFSVVCYPNIEKPARSRIAVILFVGGEYLGREELGRVRWRVDKQPPGEGNWLLDAQAARQLIREPENSKIINDLLNPPSSTSSLLIEVRDDDYDTHDRRFALTGSKEAVQETLDACGKAR